MARENLIIVDDLLRNPSLVIENSVVSAGDVSEMLRHSTPMSLIFVSQCETLSFEFSDTYGKLRGQLQVVTNPARLTTSLRIISVP